MKTYPIIKPASGETTVDLTTDLVTVWEFDETSGSTTYDAHGTNDATIGGSPTINQTGVIGACYYWNGNGGDDWASFSATPFKFNPITESYTFSFWVKSSDPSWTTTNPFLFDIARGLAGYSYPIRFVVLTASSNRVNFIVNNSSATSLNIYIAGASVWDNTWHLVTFTMNHVTTKATTYLDDSFVEEVSYPWSTYTQDSSLTTGYIGKTGAVTGRTPVMYQDQIGVWNKALSLTEIEYLHNSGSGRAYSTW